MGTQHRSLTETSRDPGGSKTWIVQSMETVWYDDRLEEDPIPGPEPCQVGGCWQDGRLLEVRSDPYHNTLRLHLEIFSDLCR